MRFLEQQQQMDSGLRRNGSAGSDLRGNGLMSPKLSGDGLSGLASGGMSRRSFLKSASALAAAPAALTVGLNAVGELAAAAGPGELATDFVRVTPDNRVVVVVKHFEAGQGPATGLATLVAEEMSADWRQVDAEYAPADNARYANLFFQLQGTGGSTAMANSFMQYRKAGAVAVAKLRAAAAKEWGTDFDSVDAGNGVLTSGNNRATFGDMAGAAAKLSDPLEAVEPDLKSPDKFTLIGRDMLPRKDLSGKTDGSAMFAMDFRPDNALHVVVLRSPKFGGKLKSFDDSAARDVRGFVGAKAIPQGVAVYADNTWAAIKARRLVKAEWDFANAETRSTSQIMSAYRAALDSPGPTLVNNGDADAALANAAKTAEAEFEFPFLAHAPMEPLNCVIEKRGDAVTMWDGCQFPGTQQAALGGVLGVPPENVKVVTLLAGGTFGRRATPTNDYQMEAAFALKESPRPARPVKLLWTREDDIRGGYYRPMFYHRARVGVDADGRLVAWRHELAGKSILIGTPFEAFAVKDGVDPTVAEGISKMEYAPPNLRVDIRNVQDSAATVLWWRSVEHTHTAFAKEVMVDMAAELAGTDPVEFRLKHLDDHPRHAGVLRKVAEMSGWGKPLPAGRFRGVAVHESFRSFAAQVAEISLSSDGAVKMEKVWCAVDCGVAVNPDVIRAQMESGIGYGLGAAMRNEVTLASGGEVEQSNFPDYVPLRMRDMPEVEVAIVPSSEPPTGVGEPGTPPIAPALSNAIHAATGKRVTKMPFTNHGVNFA